MAAKSFAFRLKGSRRFLSGFVAGAVVGAAGAGLAASQFLRGRGDEAALTVTVPEGSAEKALLGQFGFPLTGTETRFYTNHALSYDQSKREPRWVLEHISKSKIMGDADRKDCKFKPDPNIPPTFSAFNTDYIGSGWSRGHMAPAGNNKFSPVGKFWERGCYYTMGLGDCKHRSRTVKLENSYTSFLYFPSRL